VKDGGCKGHAQDKRPRHAVCCLLVGGADQVFAEDLARAFAQVWGHLVTEYPGRDDGDEKKHKVCEARGILGDVLGRLAAAAKLAVDKVSAARTQSALHAHACSHNACDTVAVCIAVSSLPSRAVLPRTQPAPTGTSGGRVRGCNPRTNGGQTRTRTGSCKQPTTRSCRPGMRYSWPWTWTCLPLPSRQTPPRPQASPGQRPFLVRFGWVTLFFAFAAGLS